MEKISLSTDLRLLSFTVKLPTDFAFEIFAKIFENSNPGPPGKKF